MKTAGHQFVREALGVGIPSIRTIIENSNFPGLMNRGSRPETKAEYDKRQSLIKRVHDPETGRIR